MVQTTPYTHAKELGVYMHVNVCGRARVECVSVYVCMCECVRVRACACVCVVCVCVYVWFFIPVRLSRQAIRVCKGYPILLAINCIPHTSMSHIVLSKVTAIIACI